MTSGLDFWPAGGREAYFKAFLVHFAKFLCRICFLYFPLGKYKKLVLHCFGKLMGMLKHGAIPKKCPCGISGTNPYLSDSDGYEWPLKFQSGFFARFKFPTRTGANHSSPGLQGFKSPK